MLLSKSEKLEELVVRTLSERPLASAVELQEFISEYWREYSVQAIYQELRKLIQAGVVVKLGQRYSLRLDWVLDLIAFGRNTYGQYASADRLQDIVPGHHERRVWRLNSINTLLIIWTQVLFVLCQRLRPKAIYEYLPHVWFHLGQWHDESQFETALELIGIDQYLMIVGDSYLDRKFEKYLKLRPGDFCFGCEPLLGGPETYYSIVDEFVMTIILTTRLGNSLDRLFTSITCAEEVDIGRVVQLFEEPTRIELKLEHAPQKAKQLTKVFTEFFGM